MDKVGIDYNLQSAITHAGLGNMIPVEGYTGPTGPLAESDIAEIVHTSEGENDGANWLWVLRLHDGRWVFVEAGCDYTGWD